jgi:hypothetical protein
MRLWQAEELTERQHIAQVLQSELMGTVESCQFAQSGVSATIYLVYPLVKLVKIDWLVESHHFDLALVGLNIIDLWPLVGVMVADVGVCSVDLLKG